jgi:hypothetical protein
MANTGSAISGTDGSCAAVPMMLCCACTGASGADTAGAGGVGAVVGVLKLIRGEWGSSSIAAAEALCCA